MSKIKLLIFCERFYPEGFLIDDLVEYLGDTDKFEIGVVSQYPSYPYGVVYEGYKNKLFGVEKLDKVKVYRFFVLEGYKDSRLKKIFNYSIFVFGSSIISLFNAKKYDKIFIYQTGPLTQAIAAVLAKKLFRKKILIWTWDLWPDTVFDYGYFKKGLPKLALEKLVKYIYSNVDRVLVSSPGFRDTIVEHGNKNVDVVYNWVKFSNQNLEEFVLGDEVSFVFAGNIGEAQGLQNVIKAFGLLEKEHKNVRFVIYGDGSEKENLEMYMLKHKIGNVVFKGRVSEAELQPLLHQSTFFVISLKDNPVYEKYIPTKFQTYLNFGKPILSAMSGEVSSMVLDYNIGCAASNSSIEEIQGAILKMLNYTNIEKQEIYERSKSLLISKFDREVNSEKIYNEIVNL